MRIVAFRVSVAAVPDTFGYGLSRHEAAGHLATKLGRQPALSELHFDPIVVDPEPHSLLITPVQQGFFVRS